VAQVAYSNKSKPIAARQHTSVTLI